METKISGIVLSKVPFKDRDIIAHLLLRNGRKISLIFFGGQGGGKKLKPSIIEIGYSLEVELDRTSHQDKILKAKEWKTSWVHDKVRYNYSAFSLMSFFVEMTSKVSLEADIKDLRSDDDQAGIYRVLSNALFYLEDSILKDRFALKTHLALFLTKLIFELGLSPELSECTLCGSSLNEENILAFEMQHGGFACRVCADKDVIKSNLWKIDQDTTTEFWGLMRKIWQIKYQDYPLIQLEHQFVVEKLFQYLCFQLQIQLQDFKTYKLIGF